MQQKTISGDYNGRGLHLFLIALSTGLLTVLTLGIYRFWAKSKIRRYVWSATAPGGAPFEYTGTGLEKFLGFLLAMVVLAIYLGVFQVLLMFFGFSLLALFEEPSSNRELIIQALIPYVTLLALSPLIFFARYRGRRYMMTRTRWRGIRFGMDKAALGYVWRGLVYLAVTILSLGLLLPMMTYRLEKYAIDRTTYGDRKFVQEGGFVMLYGPFMHFVFAVLILAGSGFLAATGWMFFSSILALVGTVWFLVASVSYRVQGWALMMNERTLEGGVGFETSPSTGLVVGFQLIGMIVTAAAFFLALAPFALMVWPVLSGIDPENPASIMRAMSGGGIVLVIGYFLALVVAGATAQAMIAQPILAHLVSSTTLTGAHKLDYVRQGRGADQADADGFADALDLGGAF